jgi:hypothetical protein
VAVQRADDAKKPHAAVAAAAPARPAAVVPPAARPAAPAVGAAAPEPVTEPVADVTPSVAKPKAAPAPHSRTAAPQEAEAPVDAEKLAEEVRVIDPRSALAAGRATDALTALDEYDARMAPRRFQPEALYLRMQALLALGRKTDARSTAARLVRSFPQSPHTARARRVLETIP